MYILDVSCKIDELFWHHYFIPMPSAKGSVQSPPHSYSQAKWDTNFLCRAQALFHWLASRESSLISVFLYHSSLWEMLLSRSCSGQPGSSSAFGNEVFHLHWLISVKHLHSGVRAVIQEMLLCCYDRRSLNSFFTLRWKEWLPSV